jgi:hypothetical protein
LKLQSIEQKIGSLNVADGSNQQMKQAVVSEADMPAVEQRMFKIEQQIVNLHNLSKPKPVDL